MLARRQALVRDNYQCRSCGHVVHGKKAHVDHIVPKADGGSDLLENLQTLCATCHQQKTNRESIGHDGDSFHPEWIRRPAMPVTVVCGAPASGKSMYVKENCKRSHVLIDFDRIAAKMAGTTEHAWPYSITDNVIKRRNKMLDSLAESSAPKAWFIVCEPLAKNRDWWRKKLSAEIVVVETPALVCEARISFDKERARQAGTATEWWSKYITSPFDSVITGQ